MNCRQTVDEGRMTPVEIIESNASLQLDIIQQERLGRMQETRDMKHPPSWWSDLAILVEAV